MTYITLLLGLILSASGAIFNVSGAEIKDLQMIAPAAVFTPMQALEKEAVLGIPKNIPNVPFYSQFHDISAPEWQKLGCGIADLAMLIEFYKPGGVSVDTLLQEGIASGAYINGAGWSHGGLVLLAEKYGLSGGAYDFSLLNIDAAFLKLEASLSEGPVIASVYYKIEPGNPIPHLIVVNGIDGDRVYYNDPSSGRGGESVSVNDFKQAWKKRFITVRLI